MRSKIWFWIFFVGSWLGLSVIFLLLFSLTGVGKETLLSPTSLIGTAVLAGIFNMAAFVFFFTPRTHH